MEKPTRLKSSPLLRGVRSAVEALSGPAWEAAEAIADFAEPAWREFKSAARLEEFLAANAFTVTRPYRDLPTAFRAVRGSGKPAIAFLAEYDAIADCGPRPGAWGHGCGHNLLGAAAALAGAAAASVLERAGRPARIIVFGCPAEETLAGKVFMAARRAFAGLDAVLAWHPCDRALVAAAGGAAMDSIRLRFRGKTAHAAGAPEKGRSALDAAVLTDVAVNYLREHVEENARIHSVITDGGAVPNVVPDRAEIAYFIRGRDRKQVDDLRRRVALCARGAATATETKWRMAVDVSVTERIPNPTIADLLDRLLRRCGPPAFTPADARAAARLNSPKSAAVTPGGRYSAEVLPVRTRHQSFSSDEDNVSWFAPLGCITMTCVPAGTVLHHRTWARMVRLPGARRGTCKAAEVLAAAAVELAVNGPLLRKAKAEFRANRRGRKYDLPMTADAPPGE